MKKDNVATKDFTIDFLKDEKMQTVARAAVTWRAESLKLDAMRDSVAKAVDALNSAHPGCDAMTIDADTVRDALPGMDGERFLISRDKIAEQAARVESANALDEYAGYTPATFWALCNAQDRNILDTYVARVYGGGALYKDKRAMLYEDGAKNSRAFMNAFRPIVYAVYLGESGRRLADAGKTVLNRFFGHDGNFFHALGVNRGGVTAYEWNNFAALYGGKIAVDPETGVCDYKLTVTAGKTVKGVIELASVMFDHAGFHIKEQTPEQSPEQSPEQTPEQSPEQSPEQTPEQSPKKSTRGRGRSKKEQAA